MSRPHSRLSCSADFFLMLKESSRCCCKGSDFFSCLTSFLYKSCAQKIRLIPDSTVGFSESNKYRKQNSQFTSHVITEILGVFFLSNWLKQYSFQFICLFSPQKNVSRPVFLPQVFPQESNKFRVSLALFPPAASDVVCLSSGQMCGAKVIQPRSSLTPVTAHFLFLLLWSVFFAGAPCYCSFSCCTGQNSELQRYGERYGIGGGTEKRKWQRIREAAHMSKQLKDTRRGRESSRLMFVKQME